MLQDGCILQYIENACRPEPVFYDRLDDRVALLKLIPGTRAELASWMLAHNDALILESFGVGGIPSYDGNDFLSVLEAGIRAGKTIVLTTQVQAAEDGSRRVVLLGAAQAASGESCSRLETAAAT